MSKKVLALLLAIVLVLSMAACNSGSNESSTASKTESKTESPASTGGDESSEASTSDTGATGDYDYYSDYPQDISGEIEFYQQKPEIEDYMYDVIDEFQALYPNITVTQNVQNDAASNLQTRAAAGDFTDVWLYWPTDMVWQSFYEEGKLMDVSDQPYVKTSAESVQALFERDGKYYGVPEANNAAGIIANIGMFEDNGIALPEDWDSFIAACDAFKEKGITPIGLTLKDGADCARNILLGDYVPGDEVKAVAAGEKKLSETDFPKSVDDLTKIYSYANDKAISSDYNTGLTDFANGESAMFISGNWTFASIRGINPDIKIEQFPLPSSGGRGYVCSGVDVGYTIGADTQYPEACNAFVNFLVSKPQAEKYCNKDAAIPAIKDITVTDTTAARMIEKVAKGESFNWPNHFFPAGGAEQLANQASTQFYMDLVDLGAEQAKTNYIAQMDGIMDGSIK